MNMAACNIRQAPVESPALVMPAISTAIAAISSHCPGLSPIAAYVTRTSNRRHQETEMPEALDLLKTRRSVKPGELTGPGPSASEIDTILTVASRVPDHGKLRPWRFIVFEGNARIA